MKPAHFLVAWIAFALFTLGLGQQVEGNSPRSLFDQLVETLNTKDPDKIKLFVQRHVISNAPVELRVRRWKGLADQGAPFKIVRDLAQTAEQATFVVLDKNGTRVAMILHYESNPKLLISGLELSAAFAIEGSPPELRNWTDLKQLESKVAVKAQTPGMGLAVIRNGKGSVVVTGFRKVGTKDFVQPDDVWSIGSIGKPICSSVIGSLIEQGKLRWDESLHDALPGVPMDAGYRTVTLEQIMRHRGGIPEDLSLASDEVKRIVGQAKTPTAIRDRYARDILNRPPAYPKGTRFAYSNAGYALLSVVAERVSGQSYEQLVQAIVFKPLGLIHSFTSEEDVPKARPIGHAEGPNGLVPNETAGPTRFMFAGAGDGLFMSVGDLAKFGAAHLEGLKGHDGFLKAATIQRLHQGIPEQPRGGRLYACGWGIETLPGVQPFHGHNGANGAMRAQLAIFPDSGLVIAAVVNRGGEAEPSPPMEAVQAIAERYAPFGQGGALR